MAINWDYNAEEAMEDLVIPEGEYRVRISETEEMVSKNTGKDMVLIKLDVSGYSSSLFYYLVFNKDSAEGKKMTNKNLHSIYESFGIQEGNLDFESWVGLTGAAKVKHEYYNGDVSSKVHYFLSKKKQANLPAWQEKAGMAKASSEGFVSTYANDDCPF